MSRINQSKRWLFTWNNPIENKVEIMERTFTGFKYVWGEEVGESGTPHIQGYIEGAKRFRPSELPFGSEVRWNDLHWEKCKGTREQNVAYCTKDGIGIVSKGLTVRRGVQLVTREMLRPWQSELADRFREPASMFDRTIHWFWEYEGGFGKSVLTKYMVDQMGALALGGAKKDCLYTVKVFSETRDVDIVIFDIPRVVEGMVSYASMEAIKDGMFCSTKYESGMCRINTPHVLCFANMPPEEHKLSADRWSIVQL